MSCCRARSWRKVRRSQCQKKLLGRAAPVIVRYESIDESDDENQEPNRSHYGQGAATGLPSVLFLVTNFVQLDVYLSQAS